MTNHPLTIRQLVELWDEYERSAMKKYLEDARKPIEISIDIQSASKLPKPNLSMWSFIAWLKDQDTSTKPTDVIEEA